MITCLRVYNPAVSDSTTHFIAPKGRPISDVPLCADTAHMVPKDLQRLFARLVASNKQARLITFAIGDSIIPRATVSHLMPG